MSIPNQELLYVVNVTDEHSVILNIGGFVDETLNVDDLFCRDYSSSWLL